MSKEKAIMRYDSQVKEELLKYVDNKFIFNLTSKKIKIPVYENRNDEELLVCGHGKRLWVSCE